MTVDYEAEYNNRARVPEHPAIMERWARDAEAYRDRNIFAELRLRYGRSARQTIDLFWPPAGDEGPLALFVHGGYWRALGPSSFSHLAAGANARKVAVAIVGYDLCPTVTIENIIEQVRAATIFLWRRHRRRILAAGHSAGGHLSACLVATDWPQLAPDLPDDLVTMGLAISGLFDLAPLMETSMNEDLRLDAVAAQRASPLCWEVPPGRTLDAWVGGDESTEFLRQSRQIAEMWGGRGVVTRYNEVAGANHFTVLDPLSDPDSPMTARLAELAWELFDPARDL